MRKILCLLGLRAVCVGFCSGFFLCLIGVKVFSWSFPCILWVISWVFVNVVNYTYLYLVWLTMRVSATSLFCCFFISLLH